MLTYKNNFWYKVSHDKTFKVAKNPKYDGQQRGTGSISHNFYDKISSDGGFIQNQELAKELHRPFITNFEKQKVYSPFQDNICKADIADMQ